MQDKRDFTLDSLIAAAYDSYLPWFEIGRTTLLKEHGLPYRQLEADGFFLPVLEVYVKYARPALYDDVLTIVTTMSEKPVAKKPTLAE